MPALFRSSILAAICILVSMPAARAEYPDACRMMYELSRSAMSYKADGMTEAQLRDVLPAKDKADLIPGTPQAEQIRAMHEILDEIFGNEGLDSQAYAVYRAEVCFRKVSKMPVPRSFKEVVPSLRECGKLQKKDLITCAMKAAGSGSSE